MAEVIVYGASDDLVEFEGAVYDEIGAWQADDKRFVFNDGTEIAATFDQQGQWRLRVVNLASDATVTHVPSREDDGLEPDEHDCPGYSDKLVFDGTMTAVSEK